MEMTNCSLNEPDKDILDAIELWYESKRSKRGNVNRNVMAVGIGISELLQNRFPLTDYYVQSDKGSQVRGLSGACIKTVLARHGGNACLRIRGRQNLTRHTPDGA